jgi:hypothetical protein
MVVTSLACSFWIRIQSWHMPREPYHNLFVWKDNKLVLYNYIGQYMNYLHISRKPMIGLCRKYYATFTLNSVYKWNYTGCSNDILLWYC